MKSNPDLKIINGLFGCLSTSETVRSHRVWLVDDDKLFRELLGSLLDLSDAVECERGFASGELLLSALARETPPRTILLDVHLRDRNGIDFIQPIKALAPATRVLMLTTFFDPEQAARARQAGASGFLVKSASFDEILEQIIGAPAQKMVAKVRSPPGSTLRVRARR